MMLLDSVIYILNSVKIIPSNIDGIKYININKLIYIFIISNINVFIISKLFFIIIVILHPVI